MRRAGRDADSLPEDQSECPEILWSHLPAARRNQWSRPTAHV